MSTSTEVQYYLRVARRRFGFFVIPLVLFLAIGVGIVMYLPAIYNSSATILVESQQIPEQFVQSTVTTLASERLEIIKQRVMTRENLLRIADKFSLFSDRKSLSKSDLVDLMRSRITFQMLNFGTTSRKQKNDNLAVAFSIGFDYERPREAANVANELVTLVLNEDIQNRANRASETTQFLNQESQRLTKELGEIEQTIASFKLKNSATLPEKLTFNMSLLEKRQRAIEEVDRNLATAATQIRLLEFERQVRAAGGGTATGGKKSGSTLEQRLQQLQTAYAERSVIYSDSHPEMKALRRQITATEDAIEKAKVAAASATALNANDPSLSLEERILAEKIDTVNRNTEALNRQRKSLEDSIDELQKTIEQTSEIGAQLTSLERRRDALQKGSDEMAIKLSQAKLGERLEENQKAERFEVIEAPIIPQEPVKPKRLPLFLLAIGASLAAGAGTALGAEFLDTTVKRSSDLTNKLNRRLLVTIPYVRTHAETRRQRLTAVLAILAFLIAIVAGLAAIHFIYMPLDILMIRLTQFVQKAF